MDKIEKIKSFILSRRRSVARTAPGVCINCGSSKAFYIGGEAIADFDVDSIVSKKLAALFKTKWNGVCETCGIFQNYIRFDRDQIASWCQQLISKDRAVSDEAFRSYPVPAEYINKFEDTYFKKRLKNWDQYFSVMGFTPRRALFIRPFFGGSPKFVAEMYGAEVSGLEISAICQQTTIDRVPTYKPLNGQVHGYFDGEFLSGDRYDAIFVFHTLCHSCDVHEMLDKLSGLMSPEGVIIFSHEVHRKPTNPFHTLYMSEWNLRGLLEHHFRRIDRIDDCDDEAADFVTAFTLKNDNPDFAVWR